MKSGIMQRLIAVNRSIVFFGSCREDIDYAS